MPELPEAETIARGLGPRVIGHAITAVTVTRPDVLGEGLTPGALAAALVGRRIAAVGRRGKNVLLRFAPDGTVLMVNLGMTGRLVTGTARGATQLRHVAVRLDLDHGQAVFYDDVRRFGRLELHGPRSWTARRRRLGPEPLSRGFTAEQLFRSTRLSRTPIRNWLLDQRRIAGVGNIYASEALFRAGVHPARPANTLTRPETRRLHRSLRAVLREAITARGTTLNDYRDAQGEAGGFEPSLRVYGREGRPCPRCRAPIQRLVLTNRSAFYCPRCQPQARPDRAD